MIQKTHLSHYEPPRSTWVVLRREQAILSVCSTVGDMTGVNGGMTNCLVGDCEKDSRAPPGSGDDGAMS